MRRATRVLAGFVVAAGAVVGASPADADGPVSEGARRRAEDAFALGMLEAVEASLRGGSSDVDLEPLRVRDVWWRPAGGASAPVPKDLESLAGRRLVWLRAGGQGPYPTPTAGESDPYPLLTALVLDRQRRETRGAARLLEETPLAPLAARSDPARYFLETTLTGALRGLTEAADETQKARRAETRALAARNQALAAAALGALLAAGALSFLWARPRARGSGAADGDGGGSPAA
jgi:hypothetical protein